MKFQRLLIVPIILAVLSLCCCDRLEAREDEFDKSQALFENSGEGKGAMNLFPMPPKAKRSNDITGIEPILKDSTYFYCAIKAEDSGKLESFCMSNKAGFRITKEFTEFFIIRKVGVLITVDPANADANMNFLKALVSEWHAAPIDELEFSIWVSVYTNTGYMARGTGGSVKCATIKEADDLTAAVFKNPYGQNCTVFTEIKRLFPTVFDKYRGDMFFTTTSGKTVIRTPIVYARYMAKNRIDNKSLSVFEKDYSYGGFVTVLEK